MSRLSAIILIVSGVWVAIAGLVAAPAQAQEITLAPGDVVETVVYGREDLSGERAIDAAGQLLVLQLGRVAAAGLTPGELETRIGQALSEKGLVSAPDVFVEVLRWRDIFVGGDVLRPGAYVWRPDMTVRQAITVAGGRGTLPPDEFSTFLQAYSVIERFESLKLSIGNLRARRARLEAEIEFVKLVFEGAGDAPIKAPERLNPLAFLPNAAVAMAEDDRNSLFRKTMSGLDIETYRAMQLPPQGGDLIVFAPAVRDNAALIDIRATQEALMGNWIEISLSRMNSLLLQRGSLVEKLDILKEKRALLDETIALSRERLDGLLKLGEARLVRAQDLQNMQTTYSSIVATQLSVITEITDTEIAIEQQNLSISNFASTLYLDLSDQMQEVLSLLTESSARLSSAGRAARVAQTYLDIDQGTPDEPVVVYEITRNISGVREVITAEATTIVLPGDTITSRNYDEF